MRGLAKSLQREFGFLLVSSFRLVKLCIKGFDLLLNIIILNMICYHSFDPIVLSIMNLHLIFCYISIIILVLSFVSVGFYSIMFNLIMFNIASAASSSASSPSASSPATTAAAAAAAFSCTDSLELIS